MHLRTPSHRRRAAREINKLVRRNPTLLAFPLWRVGFVAGVTKRRAKAAQIMPLAVLRAAIA